MRREDLERYLERGNCLGFRKQTGADDALGWILLDKQKPNERLRENYDSAPLDEAENFLNGYGLTLAEIKWLVEIGTP